MKIALTIWDNRIAPVFDVARELRLVEIASGQRIAETEERLAGDLPVQKALRLVELGVNTLICGAISRPVAAMVAGYGIQVIPYVSGDPDQVIQAWCQGTLEGDDFAMPGCCRRGRHQAHGRTIRNREAIVMNKGKRGGRGQGGGGGQGQGGRGSGGGRGQGRGIRQPASNGNNAATNNTGDCVCPQCGRREPHQRGQPCVMQTCPQCGAAMTRC